MNDFQPFWGNLWTPPLHFRRRPPQSNCPPDTVQLPDLRPTVENPNNKRVVSQGWLHTSWRRCFLVSHLSCTFIVVIQYQATVKLYGVFPSSRRLIRIFTYTSISPGPLLRQCPNRYAIRAGRNLPDKEFRYLRTVIVTAAVHWGLSSMLWITPNTSP